MHANFLGKWLVNLAKQALIRRRKRAVLLAPLKCGERLGFRSCRDLDYRMKYYCFQRLRQLGIALVFGCLLATSSFGAEAAEAHEEGIPLKPDVILHIGK